MLKVLHLSTYSIGGAGIAANLVAKTISESNNMKSILLTSNNIANPITRLKISAYNAIERKMSLWLEKNKSMIYSYSIISGLGKTFINRINNSSFDVVHLHWINGGFLSIPALLALKKPLVWHLHDLWPLSSTRHYIENVENTNPRNYNSQKRLQLQKLSSVSRYSSDLKNTLVSQLPISYIAPSRWIYEFASSAEKHYLSSVHMIPFPTDESLLTHCPDSKSNLPTIFSSECRLKILFGGSGFFSNTYKGFNDAIRALKSLRSHASLLDIHFFGEDIPMSILREHLGGYQYTSHGTLGKHQLATLLKDVHVYICTSYIESFGLLVKESIEAHTPCIAYANTGPESIIRHGYNGFIVPYRDIDSIVKKVTAFLHTPILQGFFLNAPSRLPSRSKFNSLILDSYCKTIKNYQTIFGNCTV
jgi:glycosyltransferase involved in cell wall biosynthesis